MLQIEVCSVGSMCVSHTTYLYVCTYILMYTHKADRFFSLFFSPPPPPPLLPWPRQVHFHWKKFSRKRIFFAHFWYYYAFFRREEEKIKLGIMGEIGHKSRVGGENLLWLQGIFAKNIIIVIFILKTYLLHSGQVKLMSTCMLFELLLRFKYCFCTAQRKSCHHYFIHGKLLPQFMEAVTFPYINTMLLCPVHFQYELATAYCDRMS